MSAQTQAAPAMNLFERYLSVWVALCIAIGILLGQVMPGVFRVIGGLEIARVNLPVGLLIWVMIIPMLLRIDFGALGQVKAHWRGIGVTLFINWLVKPFSMALLGWLFIRYLFAPWLPADQLDSYIAGLFCWPPRLYGNGVCLEPTHQRRPLFHAVAGGAERCHHDFRLCADCWAAARLVLNHRAVGHPVNLRGTVHRCAGYSGPALA